MIRLAYGLLRLAAEPSDRFPNPIFRVVAFAEGAATANRHQRLADFTVGVAQGHQHDLYIFLNG